VTSGVGNAVTWPIEQIREATGFQELVVGTLNVRLNEPYVPWRDFTFEGGRESIYFERCLLLIGDTKVQALIARTSMNYWGDWYLEIMAGKGLRDTYGLQDEYVILVQVRTDDNKELL